MAENQCWKPEDVSDAQCEVFWESINDWFPAAEWAKFITGFADIWTWQIITDSGLSRLGGNVRVRYESVPAPIHEQENLFPKGVYVPSGLDYSPGGSLDLRRLKVIPFYANIVATVYRRTPPSVCALWDKLIAGDVVSLGNDLEPAGSVARQRCGTAFPPTYEAQWAPNGSPAYPLLAHQCGGFHVWLDFVLALGGGSVAEQRWKKLGGRRRRIAGRSAEKIVNGNRGPSNWVAIHHSWKTGRKFTRQRDRLVKNPRRKSLKGVRKGTGCPEDKPSRFREGARFGKKVLGKAIKAALKTAVKKTGSKVKAGILKKLKQALARKKAG